MSHGAQGREPSSLEGQIEAWRAHLRRGPAVQGPDVEELEDHLREQIAVLREGGLSPDEAFLVAVKRIGAVDALTREFAREHSERLWKQLVLAGEPGQGGGGAGWWEASTGLRVALALAVAAAASVKLPVLFGVDLESGAGFYALNASFFTLPFIAAYFAWQRPVARARLGWVAVPFVLAFAVVNAFPFAPSPADTEILTTLHLPIALWLGVGLAYVGGHWHGNERRMDFIRFTGEVFIYYVLIALGGVVLVGFTLGIFGAIGMDVEGLVQRWIIPCGAVGATVVASWLVEAKQSVIENMAPVLTRVFTPLFALVLLAFVATMVWTGRGIDVEREVLIAFDLLLVVVFGLLLYSVSARDPLAPPGVFDWIQLVLLASALAIDVVALAAIGGRIFELGFTPNRVAALGENVVLLVNLGGSAVLYGGFLLRGAPFARLATWQTAYLYVFAAWAAVVAFGFPILFGFA